MTFKFTEAWTNLNLDSRLVKAVYFDNDTQRMLVRLNGDKQYVYPASKADAKAIAEAGSKGRAYNAFRSQRHVGGGSYAHGERVEPRPVLTQTAGAATNVTNNLYLNQTLTNGNVFQAFEVTYLLEGKTFKSTAQASDLVAAAQDVAGKLNALGLHARLTGVVAKS